MVGWGNPSCRMVQTTARMRMLLLIMLLVMDSVADGGAQGLRTGQLLCGFDCARRVKGNRLSCHQQYVR